MKTDEFKITELTILNAAAQGDAVSFALRIDGGTRSYDAPYYAHAGGALRGFDLPVEVRRILRVHGAASRELVRLLLRVMDGEQPSFPQSLSVEQEAQELQAV